MASEVFREADEDCSGKIDAAEIGKVLKKLGLVLSGDEIAEVMRRYDVGSTDDLESAGNGTLDEKEWIELVSDLIDGTFDAKAVEAVEQAAKEAEVGAERDPIVSPAAAPHVSKSPSASPTRNAERTHTITDSPLPSSDANDAGAPSSASTATTPCAHISAAPRASFCSGAASDAEVEKLRAENRVLASRVFELEAANARLEERMDALERRLDPQGTPTP